MTRLIFLILDRYLVLGDLEIAQTIDRISLARGYLCTKARRYIETLLSRLAEKEWELTGKSFYFNLDGEQVKETTESIDIVNLYEARASRAIGLVRHIQQPRQFESYVLCAAGKRGGNNESLHVQMNWARH